MYSFIQRAKSVHGGDGLVALSTAVGCAAVLGEAYLRTDLADAQSPSSSAYGPSTTLIEERHVRQLERHGVVVIKDALSRKALLDARDDIQRYRRAGGGTAGDDINDANISEGKSSDGFENHGNEDDVRQDMIAWLRPTSQNGPCNGDSSNGIHAPVSTAAKSLHVPSTEAKQAPIGNYLAHCIDLIRGVAQTLESQGYAGSHSHRVPLQCQLALYSGDGKSGYARHLDRCNADMLTLGLLEWLRLSDYRSRAITAILYLNDPGRTPEDGGALRCWLRVDNDDDGGNQKNDGNHEKPMFDPPFDVQPTGGTLLIFDSDRLEHMVLPSSKDRYALTVWVSGEQNTISATQ